MNGEILLAKVERLNERGRAIISKPDDQINKKHMTEYFLPFNPMNSCYVFLIKLFIRVLSLQ